MNWIHTFSTDNSGQPYIYAPNDNTGIYVAKNVSVFSTSIYLIGSFGVNNMVVIAGSVASAGIYMTIWVDPSTGNGPSYLTVEETGQVFGLGNVAVDLDDDGQRDVDLHLANYGLISSVGDSAVVFRGVGDSNQSEIINSGTIRSTREAVTIDSKANDTLVLDNTGLIEAGKNQFSYYAAASTTDRITNAGTMIGSIYLGKGDDLYDGQSGKVTGFVAGGDGADKLLGGKGSEGLIGDAGEDTISGGAGNDIIDGGAGKDHLSGGKGNDEFSFFYSALAGDLDSITDFSSVKGNDDGFRLSHTLFPNIALGDLSSQSFKNITTGNADADDRILYEQSTGHLYYDGNGSGAGERVMFADLARNTLVTNADFYVF